MIYHLSLSLYLFTIKTKNKNSLNIKIESTFRIYHFKHSQYSQQQQHHLYSNIRYSIGIILKMIIIIIIIDGSLHC